MGDDISAPDKQAALRIAARAAISMTGQNRVWKSGIVFRRALVEGNLDLARQARDAILGELKVTTAEGLQIDDSFHQHGPQQQMGNYGLGFAGDMAAWGLIWRGTTLAIPEEKLALLRGYILNGEALVTANGMMDISACGRQLFVGSAGAKGRGVLRLLAAMEQVDPGTALRYRAAAVQDSQPVGSGLPTLPGAVMNKDFFRSDYMVHRRPAFYASVKLCSLRVIGGELVNAENISGRYLADGALFLYQTGREYADIFPVWDWRRVPGVTCVTTGTTLRPAGLMATDFAGGVSDGTYGAAGLDCHRDGVSARKACFFLDNAVVCLGAGITGTTGSIRTSIDQRLAEGTPATSRGPMTPGVNQCKAVSWVLNGAQGYLFPHPQDVFAGTQAQTGTWKNVYAAGSPAQITKDIFSIWINHDPGNGAYGYTMIPAANVAKLQAFVTHPPAEIVSNTREVQAVRDNAAGVTEILFYKPAALNAGNLSISADHPCAILIRNGLIDLADPTQKAPSVTLTINGKRTSVPLPQGEKAGSAVRVTAT
jgi:chondroitin AC lyase